MSIDQDSSESHHERYQFKITQKNKLNDAEAQIENMINSISSISSENTEPWKVFDLFVTERRQHGTLQE